MIITIGRKPFKGSLIDHVKVEGCGGLNINETRIGTVSRVATDLTPKGRWPANVLLSIDAPRILDEQTGRDQDPEKGKRGFGASRYFKKVGK